MFRPISFGKRFTERFFINRVTGFATRYKSLSRVIKKTLFVLPIVTFFFLDSNIQKIYSSGQLEFSLLYLMHGAKSKRDGQGIWRDAKLIEKSMAGLGTKDAQLIYRYVSSHSSTLK